MWSFIIQKSNYFLYIMLVESFSRQKPSHADKIHRSLLSEINLFLSILNNHLILQTSYIVYLS